jgi:uncharacterized repeat protein (TIGR03843 family)
MVSASQVLSVLSQGEMEVNGLLPWGSNYTFLVEITHEGIRLPAVYKPARGERPLWDFPDDTLFKREVAAYVVCEALGWGFVPPTVGRDGAEGPGSVQFYVDADPENHYFNFTEEQKQQLKHVAAYDILVNNADRKGGHVLLDRQGELWAIDHGLCFHTDPKLRTVIWDFAGQPIPPEITEAIRCFRKELTPSTELHSLLGRLIAPDEIAALRRRADWLIAAECYPQPGSGRNYPWPPL